MSKRFTDTEIWDKEWFMALTPTMKCLVKFIYDKCDNAGVWPPNWPLASIYIGHPVTKEDLQVFGNRVEFLPDGKIFIPEFIRFQYGELSENCAPHKKIFSLLKKYGLTERVLKGYFKPTNSLEEKDKDKEGDKEGEVDKGGMGENSQPEQIYLIPEMVKVWKECFPNYLSVDSMDYPELKKLVEIICKEENIINHESNEDLIPSILSRWRPICEFVKKDKFYCTYNISQVVKYIQSIGQKLQNTVNKEPDIPPPRTNIITQALSANAGAKAINRNINGK